MPHYVQTGFQFWSLPLSSPYFSLFRSFYFLFLSISPPISFSLPTPTFSVFVFPCLFVSPCLSVCLSVGLSLSKPVLFPPTHTHTQVSCGTHARTHSLQLVDLAAILRAYQTLSHLRALARAVLCRGHASLELSVARHLPPSNLDSNATSARPPLTT